MNAMTSTVGLMSGTGNVTVDLVHRLGRDIVAGRYEPGTILPNEAAMTVSFAISRTAVREAVKMLSAKGLVESRPRRGTQVRPVRHWNLLDSDVLHWLRQTPPDRAIIIELIELRLGFEPEAAALAARKGQPAQIADIGAAHLMMQESVHGRYDPVDADCQFHEAILAATGNRFYQPLAALIRTALSLTAPVTNALFGHSVGDLKAHEQVLRAIENRDDKLAFELMQRLLNGNIEAVMKVQKLPLGRALGP